MGRYRKYIVLIIIMLLININLNHILAIENDANRNFKRVTVEDGLSQSTVTKIFQDSSGYMWIGTKGGLNRYNGHKFDIYKYNENDERSIAGNHITDIDEDKEGNIWIGTSIGISKFNTKTKEIKNYIPNKDGCKLSHNRVRDILVSEEGTILVGTDDGLNIYDEKNDNFIRIYDDSNENYSLSEQTIYSLEEDNENYWVGTRYGLNKINKNTNKIIKYYSSEEENSLVHNWIYKLHIDNKGYMWVGTHYGGLNRIKLDTWEIDTYTIFNSDIPGNDIRNVLRDSRGMVWIATDFGFAKLDEETSSFTVYKSRKYDNKSMCSDDIYSIYESGSGNIWIGTQDGVNIFNPQNLFKHYKNSPIDLNSLSENSITGIYKDKDKLLWIGTMHSGVNIFDRKNDKIIRLNRKNEDIKYRISDDLIRDIVGIDNEIWIATQNGLNKYDKNTNKITVYKDQEGLAGNDITSLHIDSEGLLWVGTTNGLSTFDRKNIFKDYAKMLEEEGVPRSQILDIHEDKNNLLWFSTNVPDGLISYDKSKNKINRYIGKDSEQDYNSILSINSDSKGNLWLGTQYGLIKFDPINPKYKRYTENDGLGNNIIYGVLLDDKENIWVSSNYGISRLNSKNEKITNFDSTDGLQDNEFNQYSYYRNSDGEMFFGGINGLTAFNPNDIIEKTYIPNVQFDNIVANDENLDMNNVIDLGYDYDRLQFTFFMPDYSNIRKIQYAYKLKGVDKGWIFAEHRNYATYTNLKHGEYIFEVVGRNSSGVWSSPTSVKINIATPPWKTHIAYFIYTLVISGIIYFIYNRVKLLDKLVKQRTIELNKKLEENKQIYSQLLKYEKCKNNYFINLSHELRTPLNVIVAVQKLIENLNQKKEDIPKNKIDNYMGTIDRNCQRLSNLIDNIIYASKIELGNYELNIEEHDIVSLVEDIVYSMKEHMDNKNIEFIVDTTVEEKIIECDKACIVTSIKNIISNAIKFTEPGGNIEVHIIDFEDYINIYIKDTGIGIDIKHQDLIFNRFNQNYEYSYEEHGGKGLSLTLTRQLLELHHGYIWLESELGKGSEFKISLPVKQNISESYN